MTTIEAARLLIKIVVTKHLHDLAPITHGLTADLEKLWCLIHDHMPMVNPTTFPLEGSLARGGGGGVPPPHPHTRHVPRARLADGIPVASFTSFFEIGFRFFLRSTLDRIRLPQCGTPVSSSGPSAWLVHLTEYVFHNAVHRSRPA